MQKVCGSKKKIVDNFEKRILQGVNFAKEKCEGIIFSLSSAVIQSKQNVEGKMYTQVHMQIALYRWV